MPYFVIARQQHRSSPGGIPVENIVAFRHVYRVRLSAELGRWFGWAIALAMWPVYHQPIPRLRVIQSPSLQDAIDHVRQFPLRPPEVRPPES